ncbi:MAG: phosphoribosylformylglycinamidine synthase subunit PurS [Deltaproteobacteria bacterium]|jgi:phosphoribosylformylglycinamidine synthase|nr:phosphoribosylformylglycinamidine synthase subunit PurS [Deltaproteobacteria bacterium]
MKFKASIKVMLKPVVLDPQGTTLQRALNQLGHENVKFVRVGKLVELVLESPNPQSALEEVNTWADQLLANPVMETYSVKLEPQS